VRYKCEKPETTGNQKPSAGGDRNYRYVAITDVASMMISVITEIVSGGIVASDFLTASTSPCQH
jgi:hypothetical protein